MDGGGEGGRIWFFFSSGVEVFFYIYIEGWARVDE